MQSNARLLMEKLTPHQKEVLIRADRASGWVPVGSSGDTISELSSMGLMSESSVAGAKTCRITASGHEMAILIRAHQGEVEESSEDGLTVRLARRVRAYRQSIGLRQGHLAAACRMSRHTLAGIERHTTNPSLRQISALARELRVPAYLLIGPEDAWRKFMADRMVDKAT